MSRSRWRPVALLALCCPLTQVVGQVPEKVTFGVLAGLSVAEFRGADSQGAGLSGGLAAGVFLRAFQSTRFGLESEALLVQKGSSLAPSAGFDGHLRISYFEIPVLLRIKLAPGSVLAPSILLGPALGFKVGCHVGGHGVTVVVDETCEEAGLPLKSHDYSVVLGVSCDWKKLVFQARYELGLGKIESRDNPADLRNQSVVVLVGLSL